MRGCEQMGIEASAEIQIAARKVLEENRKLRLLLHERGISEAEIVTAMGCPSHQPYEHVSAAPALSAMLERRIACNGPSYVDSPISTASSISKMGHNTPAGPPLCIPVQRTTALSSNDSPSPHSIVSSMDTPPDFQGTPFYGVSMTPAPEIKTEDNAPYIPYDQPFTNSWTYANDVQYVADPTSYYNKSSCVDAANIIRTMRSDVGPELEVDLGCRAPGQDCYVNNAVVFNIMDKYGNPRGV